MNKEQSPLEALEENHKVLLDFIKYGGATIEEVDDDYGLSIKQNKEIIESTLIDVEKFEELVGMNLGLFMQAVDIKLLLKNGIKETKLENKKSNPLEALNNLTQLAFNYAEHDEHILSNAKRYYGIIETALKEHEGQKEIIDFIKETIEFSVVEPQVEFDENNAFKIVSACGMNIRRKINNKERELFRNWVLKECFPKELKALEIIKEKDVSMYWLRNSESVDEYNNFIFSDKRQYQKLTKEEYDLLKEVLKHEQH